MPLLVLAGARDLITPAAPLRAGYSRWGGKKEFVVMEESHHLPFVDESERFVELVASFLTRSAPPRHSRKGGGPG